MGLLYAHLISFFKIENFKTIGKCSKYFIYSNSSDDSLLGTALFEPYYVLLNFFKYFVVFTKHFYKF